MTEGGPRGDSRQDEKGARQQESGTDAPGPEEAPLAARPPLPLPPETGTATGALPPPPPPPAAAIPKRRRVWPWIVGLVAAFIVGIALGAAGQTTETLTSTSSTTTTETTTVEADPATVTTTRVRTEVRLRPPPSSGVKVSYGDWEGLFRIHGANVTSDSFGGTITAQVVGQFEYLGGADCDRLGYVAVSGTFFDSSGRIVGTGLWNSTTAPEGVRIPMEVGGLDLSGRPSRAELVVTSADCD